MCPFLLATVVTTDTIVPNIVKRRSAEIFKILRNGEALRTDFETVTNSLKRLEIALKAMESREVFSTNPTKENFGKYLEKINNTPVGDNPGQLSQGMSNWLLATARTVVGTRKSNIGEYFDWYNTCSEFFTFDSEHRRYEPDSVQQDAPDTCKMANENNDEAPE